MEDQAAAQEVQIATVGKQKKSTDLLNSIASEVEQLSKTKALNMAASLVDSIETDYFKLGGVLQVIHSNSWFEGFETFDAYVYQNFGFKSRKARYLTGIYTALVSKQIPWEKVQGLGWTKLKDLAVILTPENVDEWVAKATPLTVLELQGLLNAAPQGGKSAPKTTSDTKKMAFVFKDDQIETVTQAMNKAKAEVSTDHDNVAIEMICANYLSGGSLVSTAPTDLKAAMLAIGWQAAISQFGELFGFVDIEVTAIHEDQQATFAAEHPESPM